jgi:hypothetical protein
MSTNSTVTATLSSDISYFFVDSSAGSSINETASLGYGLTLDAGTGTGQINAAVRYTGYLPSGGSTDLSFIAFPKPILGGSYNVNFIDIKGLIVENQWNGSGAIGGVFDITSPSEIAYLTLQAPGASGFTGLFNGTDGQVRLSPQSTWIFNDRLGVSPQDAMLGTTNHILALVDSSNSGIPVSVIAVGVTG